MPIHWKGWAVIFLLAAGFTAGFWLLRWALEALGYPSWADEAPFLLIFPAVIWGWVVAERHSLPPNG